MAGIFSPPRGRPRIRLVQPTMQVGQPFVAPQVIPTAVNLVGDDGTVYGRMGENGQEDVTVRGSGLPTSDTPGGPNYASGGRLLIGAPFGSQEVGTTNTPGIQPPGNDPTVHPPNQTTWPGWYTNPAQPVFTPPTGMQNPDPSIYANPNNPNATILQTQQNQLAARNQQLAARERVLQLMGLRNRAQPAISAAQQRVNTLRTVQNMMNRGVYEKQRQNQEQTLGEQTSIYRASKNIPDLTNVAQAQQAYAAENRRAASQGVSPPVDITLPPEANVPLAPGFRPKIMSQEERLAERAGYERPIRESELGLMQTASNLQGTDIRAAELAAEQLGIGTNELDLAIKDAQLAEDYASLGTSRADLAEAQNKLAPFPGAELYTNPETGEGTWVTPWKATLLRKEAQKRMDSDRTGVATRYSNTPYYGGFSINELEQMLINGSGTATYEGVMNELIVRGYTPEQARAFIRDVQARIEKRGGGGLQEVGVSSANAPAAAPTGTSSATNLPPSSTPTNLNPFVR